MSTHPEECQNSEECQLAAMAFFGVWVEFFGANRAIGQKTANRFDAPLSV